MLLRSVTTLGPNCYICVKRRVLGLDDQSHQDFQEILACAYMRSYDNT